MKDENMLKKKDFGDAAVVAALRRGHRQRLYFEQIAVFRHKFMNYSGNISWGKQHIGIHKFKLAIYLHNNRCFVR